MAFSGTLHCPAGGLDLGVGGVSYVEMLILHELWAGIREGPSSVSSARASNFSVGWSVWSRHWYLTLLSFHWCNDEVSLLATWWAW